MLLSVLVVGGLTSFTVAGTYASLTAESTNHNATISSGTLVLSNTVKIGTTTGSACFSYGSTTNSKSCDPLVLSSTVQYPGGSVSYAYVTIANTGSVPAGSLALYMPNCTVATTSGATTVGGGNPCTTIANGLAMYVEETDSSFTTTSPTATCKFPTISASLCTLTAGSFGFMHTKGSATTTYSLGEGLAAGQIRYYIVAFQLPSTAANNLQGEQANFDLTWLASQ